MVKCALPALALAVALVLLAGQATLAADDATDRTHMGKVVNAGNGKLTMTTDGKEHAHTVPTDAKITLDGKECKLEDLKPGTEVRVTTGEVKKVALRIEAKSK